MNVIRTIRQSFWVFIKFNLVGLLNTMVDFAVFSTLTIFLGAHYILAHFLAYLCGMINSYFWNKYWTFRKPARVTTSEAFKFVVVNLISLIISAIALYLIREWAHMEALPSKIIATVMTMIINFTGNRLWTFRPAQTSSLSLHSEVVDQF